MMLTVTTRRLSATPFATPSATTTAGPLVAAPGAPQFLTTEEAAQWLRLSPRTLEKQRVLGGGPRFRKFGTRVFYAHDDLRAWADCRAYDMTSDPRFVQRRSVR